MLRRLRTGEQRRPQESMLRRREGGRSVGRVQARFRSRQRAQICRACADVLRRRERVSSIAAAGPNCASRGLDPVRRACYAAMAGRVPGHHPRLAAANGDPLMPI